MCSRYPRRVGTTAHARGARGITMEASGGRDPSGDGERGRGIQRRKLPLHSALRQRQTPGTGRFHDLHRVPEGVRDLHRAEGEPFL
jgi:hypothetical protein